MSEDPFPHLMQRQAMTYLRQLKSTSPLGPCLLMAKKPLQSPSLNPLAGTECNLVARRTAPYRSVWGHRVIGCRPANPLAPANQSVMSLPLMNVGQYPSRYSKPIPSHVRAAGSDRSVWMQQPNMCLRTYRRATNCLCMQWHDDRGAWLSLGDQNVKEKTVVKLAQTHNPLLRSMVHGCLLGRNKAEHLPPVRSLTRRTVSLCLGLS